VCKKNRKYILYYFSRKHTHTRTRTREESEERPRFVVLFVKVKNGALVEHIHYIHFIMHTHNSQINFYWMEKTGVLEERVSLKGYLVFIYIYPPRRWTGELRKKGKLYIGVWYIYICRSTYLFVSGVIHKMSITFKSYVETKKVVSKVHYSL